MSGWAKQSTCLGGHFDEKTVFSKGPYLLIEIESKSRLKLTSALTLRIWRKFQILKFFLNASVGTENTMGITCGQRAAFNCPPLAYVIVLNLKIYPTQIDPGQLSRQSAPIRTSAKRKRVTRAWPYWTDWTNISDHIREKIINISTEMGHLHVQKSILLD